MLSSLQKPLPKLALMASVLLGLTLTAGCSAPASDPSPETPGMTEQFLAEHHLTGKTVTALVDELDRIPLGERSDEFTSSITAEALILSDREQNSVELPLPADHMYVSVAPFETQTHDCFNHSPTSCIGELRNAWVTVKVTDRDGNAILEERTTTFDNGFVGLWLPRDVEGTLAVTHAGKSGSVPISTSGSGAKTCETTLRLR